MDIGKIEGATRCLGAPPDWDADKNGPCDALFIADVAVGGGNVMVSEWRPTQEEIERMAAGVAVGLWLRTPACQFDRPWRNRSMSYDNEKLWVVSRYVVSDVAVGDNWPDKVFRTRAAARKYVDDKEKRSRKYKYVVSRVTWGPEQ